MKKIIFLCLCILSSMCVWCAEPTRVRPQIWDFGAVSFDRTQYENMLTTKEINGWMPAAIPGSPDSYISDFLASRGVNLAFYGHGGKDHRLRTMNTKLSRFDEVTMYDYAHGATFTGVLVSNAHADPDVYIEQTFNEGDYIEYAVASTGVPATYRLSSEDWQYSQTRTISGHGVEVIWFTIPRKGRYRLSCLDDKMMVARIVRYPAEWGELVINTNMPKQCSLAIVNRENGATHTLQYGETTVRLPLGFVYGVTLLGDPTKMISTVDSINFQHTGQGMHIKVKSIELNVYKGKIVGLPPQEQQKLSLVLTPKYPTTFHAYYELKGNRYTLYTEPNNQYIIRPQGVNDYVMDTVSVLTDLTQLKFTKRPTYEVHIQSQVDLSGATLQFTNTNEPDYVYSFAGDEDVYLRTGTYSVAVLGLDSFALQRTSLLQVKQTTATKRLEFRKSLNSSDSLDYQDTLYVGPTMMYTTIRQALRAVNRMRRSPEQHVTIAITPGQYDEMLRITQSNISLVNAADIPSNALKNGGTDIHKQAVRITGYYGAEYNYFSMTETYQHSNLALRVNMENNALGVLNSSDRKAFFNATVVVTGQHVTLENLIIENAFNRYITRLEARDRLISQYAETPDRPVNYMSTEVQDRRYRRPATAVAVIGMADYVTMNSCRIVGVENTFHGDAGCRVYMRNCHIMGAHNVISGGMTLLCYQSSLDLLPSDANDYVISARTQAGLRGFLFYQCIVRSAEPIHDMVSGVYAAPRHLVKPENHYGEVLFVDTQFDLAMEDMGYDPALLTEILDPDLADTDVTPYLYTRGTDGWNPTHDPEGAYDNIVDLKLGIHTENGQLVMHHIDEPTTMRVITSDGSSFIDQLLTGTQTFAMPKGAYWLIFENNKGKQSTKLLIE